MADTTLELTQEQLDAKINQAVEKLTSKNADLMDELKKARGVAKAFDGLDPEQVRKAVETANNSAAKALEDKGEYEKALELAKKQHAKEISKLTEQLETAQGGEKQLRIETAIDKAMDEAKVAPHMRKAVKAMHLADISIIDQDGKPAAMVGDKSVIDHLKSWADTDEGKFFVGDSGASGGGAGGGTGGGGGVNPWAKESRNLTLQGITERDNPALAAQQKREAGVEA